MRINRASAINATIERNPKAFRPKFAASKAIINPPLSLQGTPLKGEIPSSIPRHSKGWACKKSNCLK